MKQPDKTHAAWRRMLALQNVRAAYLAAKQRLITARLAQGLKQLPLPLEDVA